MVRLSAQDTATTVQARGSLCRIGGAVVTGVLAAAAGPAAAADGAFCGSLKTVVAEARDGFEALRGAKIGYVPDDGGGDDKTRYAAIRTLPGATRCGVDRDHADGEDLLSTYVCWFPPGPDVAAQVRRLAGRISNCIGRSPGDQFAPSAAGDTANISRKDYAISVKADAPGQPAVLEIGQR